MSPPDHSNKRISLAPCRNDTPLGGEAQQMRSGVGHQPLPPLFPLKPIRFLVASKYEAVGSAIWMMPYSPCESDSLGLGDGATRGDRQRKIFFVSHRPESHVRAGLTNPGDVGSWQAVGKPSGKPHFCDLPSRRSGEYSRRDAWRDSSAFC